MLNEKIAAVALSILLAGPALAQETTVNPEECDEQTANQQNDECVAVPIEDDVTGFVPLAIGPLLGGLAGAAAIGALAGTDSTNSTN